MYIKLLGLFCLIFCAEGALSQTEKLQEEKELEMVNFSSIKKVLQQDGLSEQAKQKTKQIKVMKKAQASVESARYFYPPESELWGLASEYWLVKNAQVLGWDFNKPDYGLDTSFKAMMEKLGFYHKHFKILLLNSPVTIRSSLPGAENEVILLLSVPFVRSMDLTKLEISLLLMEDYLRMEAGFFKKNVGTEKLKKLAGTNFEKEKVDPSLLLELLKNYDKQINQKGYTFQEMFEVTKKMDGYLKSTPELWNTYFKLLGKIDRFVKSNAQYKDYVRLFPSPEMQIKWLSPDEKVL